MQVFSLRRTLLQPRLFQQACRLASTSARRIAARNKRLAAASVHRAPRHERAEQDDEEDAIRWFEKDVETGVTRRVEGNPEEMEAEELRRKIAALEKELKEYRNEDSDEDLLAALEPHERAKVEQALKERDRKEKEITSGLDVSLEMPPLAVPLLKRFNAALHNAALDPTKHSLRKELWRWYARARYSIPALPSMIPKKAWQLLWDVQSNLHPTNPERLRHMEQLLSDMLSADLEIMPDQTVVYIDILLALKKFDQAIASWQDVHESSNFPSEALLVLGVRLFSKNRRLEKAHKIMSQLVNTFPKHDPRSVIPLLRASLAAGNDNLAFAYYVFMTQKLGDGMKMDDYDDVYLAFMKHGKKDFALAVFRDMMLRGASRRLRQGFLDKTQQTQFYKDINQRLDLLNSSVKDSDELNKISLGTLSVLPVEWRNKFFYGSWLKKLIGMQELEAATKVVELMYERGVAPDPKHMNGLIGAFFRSGIRELQDRGEEMAWAMIQQRLDFMYRSRQVNRNEIPAQAPSVYKTEEGFPIPRHLARPVPRATMETFNVLALHYSIHKKWVYIIHLDRMRRPAQYKMDTYFFNQILNMRLNNNDEVAMWNAFLRQAKHTQPDVETYNCLWTGQIAHVDSKRSTNRPGFPLPRQMFALMNSWFSRFDNLKQALVIEDFTPELYAKIISSFCLSKDFAGCLVALHGIAKSFKVFPDPDIARIVVNGVTNIPDAHTPTIRVNKGRRQLANNDSRLQKMSKVMAQLASSRATAAMKEGIDVTNLDPEGRQNESLNLLSEFIRLVLIRLHGNADAVESSIIQASTDMGLEGISTGDKDSSNVNMIL